MAVNVREGFAERFKQALFEAGYGEARQRELGKLFGVTPQAVRKWLAGEAMPNSSRAPKVAAALDVRKAWLFDNEAPMRPVVVNMAEAGKAYALEREVLSISGDEYRLLVQFRALSKAQKEAVKGLLVVLQQGRPGEP